MAESSPPSIPVSIKIHLVIVALTFLALFFGYKLGLPLSVAKALWWIVPIYFIVMMVPLWKELNKAFRNRSTQLETEALTAEGKEYAYVRPENSHLKAMGLIAGAIALMVYVVGIFLGILLGFPMEDPNKEFVVFSLTLFLLVGLFWPVVSRFKKAEKIYADWENTQKEKERMKLEAEAKVKAEAAAAAAAAASSSTSGTSAKLNLDDFIILGEPTSGAKK